MKNFKVIIITMCVLIFLVVGAILFVLIGNRRDTSISDRYEDYTESIKTSESTDSTSQYEEPQEKESTEGQESTGEESKSIDLLDDFTENTKGEIVYLGYHDYSFKTEYYTSNTLNDYFGDKFKYYGLTQDELCAVYSICKRENLDLESLDINDTKTDDVRKSFILSDMNFSFFVVSDPEHSIFYVEILGGN